LLGFYNRRNYNAMVGHAKSHLRLDLGIRLGMVNSGGPQGDSSVPAWVEMPVDEEMPLMGTQMFRSLQVTMYLRKSHLQKCDFEATVCTIAHELCHIVLNGARHPLRTQEEAVDLTAMLMGFRDFYVTGAHSLRDISTAEERLTGTTKYLQTQHGYLSREEVGHAATYMTYRRK
jgi:hypothetical protein